MTSRHERRAADRFWSELSGEQGRTRGFGEAFTGDPLPASPRPMPGPEPFFGDGPGVGWTVIAWPGSRLTGVRADDLIVRRSSDGAWHAIRADDVPPSAVFRARSRHLRGDTIVLRRGPVNAPAVPAFRQLEPAEQVPPPPPPPVCGFFGPHGIRRTEAEVRAAVVTIANLEWAAWHNGAVPRFESDRAMFGRLVGYYLAVMGALKTDTLLAIQAAAATANYTPLLDATAATAGAAIARLAPGLVAGAPADRGQNLAAVATTALTNARQAHVDVGGFRHWSAVFVVTCIRSAAIGQGLETIVGTDRRHVGRDALLVAAVAHATYVVAARARRAAQPPQRGTYHAFTAAERAPQRGDIIVLDRAATKVEHVTTLAKLKGGATHGDIVVDVQDTCVITVGGNLSNGADTPPANQDSVRKRRYPIDAGGMLVRVDSQLFTQEDDTGTLPALPSTTTGTGPLHTRSTARIFAVLGLVEDCVPAPGQPARGGAST